jgi:hypothetical protein
MGFKVYGSGLETVELGGVGSSSSTALCWVGGILLLVLIVSV